MDELMKCATNIKHLISPMFRCPKMLEPGGSEQVSGDGKCLDVRCQSFSLVDG